MGYDTDGKRTQHRVAILPADCGMAPEPWRRVATAVSFHVELAGSNVTGDGSQAHPWRSIQCAVTSVPNGPTGNPAVIHAGFSRQAPLARRNGRCARLQKMLPPAA